MNGAAGFSPTPRRSTSPAAATGRWPTPKASATSVPSSRVPANTYGTLRSGGPTSSRRTITARPTTSPGWSGRSPRPCERWKLAAASERIECGNRGSVLSARARTLATGRCSSAVLRPGRLHIARQIGPFCTVQLAVAKALQSRLTAVRAENLVHGSDQHGCLRGHPTVMIIDYVPAVRVPPDHTGCPVAAAVPAQGGVEDRRDLDPAPPRRPATPSAAPPEAELGGPGPARHPAQRDTRSTAPGTAASGHPGNDRALAP